MILRWLANLLWGLLLTVGALYVFKVRTERESCAVVGCPP